jgi:flagellar biosynthetic protein FliQ
MNEEMVIYIAREAFYNTILVAGPLLALALVIGLIISIFQAATSISEQTLTFVPKLIAVFIVAVLALPFMLGTLKTFTIEMISLIPTLQ